MGWFFFKLFGLCEEKKEIKYTEHYLNNIKAMIRENKRQEIQSWGVMCYPSFQLLCPFIVTAEKKIGTVLKYIYLRENIANIFHPIYGRKDYTLTHQIVLKTFYK